MEMKKLHSLDHRRNHNTTILLLKLIQLLLLRSHLLPLSNNNNRNPPPPPLDNNRQAPISYPFPLQLSPHLLLVLLLPTLSNILSNLPPNRITSPLPSPLEVSSITQVKKREMSATHRKSKMQRWNDYDLVSEKNLLLPIATVDDHLLRRRRNETILALPLLLHLPLSNNDAPSHLNKVNLILQSKSEIPSLQNSQLLQRIKNNSSRTKHLLQAARVNLEGRVRDTRERREKETRRLKRSS